MNFLQNFKFPAKIAKSASSSQHCVEAWIDEIEQDIKQGIVTENLVNCLREMLDYIRQLEKAYFKLKKEIEELKIELEEADSGEDNKMQ